jgi:hypothetical protein
VAMGEMSGCVGWPFWGFRSGVESGLDMAAADCGKSTDSDHIRNG